MRKHTLGALAALAILTTGGVAFTAATAPLTLQPQSKLWVDGTSTVRSFSCKATAFDVAVDAPVTGAASAVIAGNKVVRSVDVKVPSAKLDCGNATMNEHMMKAIKGKDNPTIAFKLGDYEIDRAGAVARGRLTGTLTLGGVQKPITLRAEAKEENGTLHVTGTQEIRMTEWGLKPPSLMMGTMKVGEVVKVSFDLYLKG